MKGVHLGIEALGLLKKEHGVCASELGVYGKGPELKFLKALSKELGVEDVVAFKGIVPYGEPFFREIRAYDFMLFTNLNAEQPRLLFDAASQGMIVICPDSAPYLTLGFDRRCFYECGNSSSLANTVSSLLDGSMLLKLMGKSLDIAAAHTVDSMHAERATWIANTLEKQVTGGE